MGNYQNQPKKEKLNEVQLIGILRPRSRGENDPIQVYNFNNGGAIVHVIVKVEEPTGKFDENGQPKVKKGSFLVDISTNKNITAQTLAGLVSGMKVRVVGRLANKSYDDKQTGAKVNSTVVDAFVLEILQQAAPMPGYGPAPMPGYGQAAPQYQQPVYGQQAPAPMPGYAPAAPQYQQAPQMPAQAPAPAPVPPYYAPAQQGQQYPPMPAQAMPQQPPQYQPQYAPQQAPAPMVEDLP